MVNDMCKTCKLFGNSCKGEFNLFFSGCIYYEEDLQKKSELIEEEFWNITNHFESYCKQFYD